MFLFPVLKFWQYTPLQFACVLAWNFSEICKFKLPYAHRVFGIIMKSKPKKVG